MRFLGWNMLLSSWLLVSAFVLPHAPVTLAITVVAAVLTFLVAVLSAGRPAVRYLNAALAVAIAVVGLLGPMPATTAVHNAIVAAILFALSVVSPVHVAAPAEPAAERGTS